MRKTFRYPFREFFFFASPKAGSHSHVLCLSAKRPLRRGAAGSRGRCPFAGFRGAAPPGGSRENPANKPPFRRKNHARGTVPEILHLGDAQPRPARRHHSPVYRRGAAVQQQSVLAHAVQRQYRLHIPHDLRGAAIQTRKPMGFGP